MQKRELVEEVARVIYETRFPDWYWPHADTIAHEHYTLLATAAVDSLLAKLRERSPAMIEAGNRVQHDDDCTDVFLIFTAMIDTISGTE